MQLLVTLVAYCRHTSFLIPQFSKLTYPAGLVFILFIVNLNIVNAQIMSLEEGAYKTDTKNCARIWIDKHHELTFDAALKMLKNDQFRSYDSLEIPGKFMRGAYVYWIAIVVKNNRNTTYPLLLSSVRLSEDSTWHLRRNHTPTAKRISQYGEKEPYGLIPYPLRWAWIYPVAPNASDTILIKYYNFKPNVNFLPEASDARFYPGKDLLTRVQKNWYFIFGFGALFSVLTIALSIWIYVREMAFFWYAAFCFSLLLTSWWNFDVEIPALYFLSNYVEWSYTKLYINTLFPAVCHSLFLYHFFKDQSEFVRKIIRWFLYACALAAVTETFLLNTGQLYGSWIFYWWFRICLVIFGLIVLYYIRKVPGNQSKWIICGALCIYFFDIVANFFPDYYTSAITLIGMVIDIFCFTVATASRFYQIQMDKYQLILAIKTRELEQKIELQLMRKNISEELRNDIASDLHDDVGTALSGISFLGEMAVLQLDRKQDVRPILQRIINQSREMIQTMRGVVWVINPQSDRTFDFFEKIRSFAEVVLQSRQIALSFQITNPIDYALSLDVQRNLFLICKEVIVNIARHSNATNASITIQTKYNAIILKISDNGSGFDTTGHAEGNGLRNLQYRAKQIDAKLDVFSEPDLGTTILLYIPIAAIQVENRVTELGQQ